MTGDGLFGELLAWTGLATSSAIATPAADPRAAGLNQPTVAPAPGPGQKFVPPPWPFSDSTPEPQPQAAAAAAEPVPFIPTPLPFAPTRLPAAAPLPEPLQRSAAPRQAGPNTFRPPPWPFDSPREPEAPAAERGSAPVPFIPTPLPFAPTRSTYSPDVEPVIVLPEPARQHPRFGQMHAEATARATRFVTAHAGEPGRRGGNHRVVDQQDDARSPLSPRGAAVLKAVAAYGGPVPPPAPAPSAAANARAAAIERALARGRAELETDPKPATVVSDFDSERLGLGVALVCILFLEVFGAVVAFALSNGYLVLAFGLALDAAARTLGTVCAARAGKDFGPGWRWACALIGSPAVVVFAFYEDGSLVDTDLAPLAGPVAAFAIVCIIIGLAGIPAGL